MAKEEKVPPYKAEINFTDNMMLFRFKQGVEPEKDKQELPAGVYTFTRIANPSGGTGGYWLATEFPGGSGIFYGTGENYLLKLADQSGGSITIVEIKKSSVDKTHQLGL